MGLTEATDATLAEDLEARRVYSRAVEATIWGMPAVSMAASRASLGRDLDAGYGDVIYFSGVTEPRHEFLTANQDTPYVLTFLDLHDGPIVLDVPAASATAVLFGSAIDSWQVPLVDIGPTGEDAGKGGRYLFVGPGQQGDAPPDGFIVVDSPSFYVHVGLRSIAVGSGSRADAVAYAQTLRCYALADAADPPAGRYVDAYPRAWKTLARFDVSFLALLAGVIDEEPIQAKDAVMAGMLASIGIEKGKPFEPDKERSALLSRAVQEGAASMNEYFMRRAFTRFWPDRQWLSIDLAGTHGFSFYGDGQLDYDRRAGGFAYWATFAPKRLADPSQLPASFYLNAFSDASGQRFDGNHLYRLRVSPDIPARDFWSLVAYEVGTNAFIYNPLNRVGRSSYDRDALTVNDDGTVDVYVGPHPPEGLQDNWIPTEGRDFWLLLRFYGPQQPLFDKTWSADDLVKVD